MYGRLFPTFRASERSLYMLLFPREDRSKWLDMLGEEHMLRPPQLPLLWRVRRLIDRWTMWVTESEANLFATAVLALTPFLAAYLTYATKLTPTTRWFCWIVPAFHIVLVVRWRSLGFFVAVATGLASEFVVGCPLGTWAGPQFIDVAVLCALRRLFRCRPGFDSAGALLNYLKLLGPVCMLGALTRTAAAVWDPTTIAPRMATDSVGELWVWFYGMLIGTFATSIVTLTAFRLSVGPCRAVRT